MPQNNTTPTHNPIPLLTSPLKGEEWRGVTEAIRERLPEYVRLVAEVVRAMQVKLK